MGKKKKILFSLEDISIRVVCLNSECNTVTTFHLGSKKGKIPQNCPCCLEELRGRSDADGDTEMGLLRRLRGMRNQPNPYMRLEFEIDPNLTAEVKEC